LSRWTLYGTVGLLALLVVLVKIAHVSKDYIRYLFTINLDEKQQEHWTEDTSTWASLKKYLLTAPLFRKRHNREFQLSKAIGVGTLPSRLHTIFLGIYFLSNVLYCCLLDYSQPVAALRAEVRGRTGHLVVTNMLPLFLFAARNNPFIQLLGISFDTFNLFHRWLGRIVVIEGLAHTFIWGINEHNALGLSGISEALRTDRFLQYGLASTCAATFILFQSPSPIRHAFYEIFLHLHQFLAAAMYIGVLLHVEDQDLPQKPFMYFIIGIWATERFIRVIRIVYYNISRRGITKIHITALDGGACRATFEICRGWTSTPGCHIFAYIPSVSLHMSHPFSVAWHSSASFQQFSSCATLYEKSMASTPNESMVDLQQSVRGSANSFLTTSETPLVNQTYEAYDPDMDFQTLSRGRTPLVNQTYEAYDPVMDFQPLPKGRTQVSCIMSTRTGMTASLYKRAKASPGGLTLTAFLEGPYGGVRSLRSYGTVMLFAGGVGITHQLSHLKDLMSARVCSTRKVILVWSVRSVAQLGWARMWLEELTRMSNDRVELKMLFYVSKLAKGDMNIMCGSKILSGRADVGALVEREVKLRVGAMTVGVCGPGAFADDVRAATRRMMDGRNVEFWEEAFTW
jgi:predicted ferric reductase